MTQTQTAADFVCYKYDATKYIRPNTLCRKLGLTVLAVYACDRNRAVHCCSLTPAYELVFLYYTTAGPYPENDSDREALAKELLGFGPITEPEMYLDLLREENIVWSGAL